MLRSFEITNKETTEFIDGLDRMRYGVMFKVVDDADNDGKTDIFVDIEHGNLEKFSGVLAAAGVWNLILLIPYIKSAVES